MISPPPSAPSSPSPRKIKSGNHSSSALSVNNESQNENDNNSVIDNNENVEEDQHENENEDHNSSVKDGENENDSDNLSGIEFLSNSNKENEAKSESANGNSDHNPHESNNDENNDDNDKQSQRSAVIDNEKNEEENQNENDEQSQHSTVLDNEKNEEENQNENDEQSQHSAVFENEKNEEENQNENDEQSQRSAVLNNEEESQNKNENEEQSQHSAVLDNEKNEEVDQNENDKQSQELAVLENDENEDKNENNSDNQSQHSTKQDDEENEDRESGKAHRVEPVEEDPDHPPMPVQLTAIFDNGTHLIQQEPIEVEKVVEEEEQKEQKEEKIADKEEQKEEKVVEEEEQKETNVVEQKNKKDPNNVKYWADEAMQLQPLDGCSPRIIGKVIDEIRKERDNFIDLGLYQDSVQANEALTKALEYKDTLNKKNIQKKKQDELQSRLNDAQNYLSNLQSMTSRIEPNMNQSFEKEMNNLIKRQNHELNQLTVDWQSPQKQRMYNRSSANLRNLRTQSILLFNSHRFDEMELASRTADAMEIDESIRNQRKLENDFQDALNKMLDRHQKEREQLKIAQQVQKKKYEAAKSHDFMIAQRRIDKLEREIEDSKDPEKVWIHYSRAEAKGPPGPRPKPREGRKNGLQAINTKDFNTLNLPPLLDSPKWKMDSPRSARERQERAKEIAALSRTEGSAGLAAIVMGRRQHSMRASYGESYRASAKKRKT